MFTIISRDFVITTNFVSTNNVKRLRESVHIKNCLELFYQCPPLASILGLDQFDVFLVRQHRLADWLFVGTTDQGVPVSNNVKDNGRHDLYATVPTFKLMRNM